jgi:pyridine nucleotide-disulfide oxidoreductase family protein
VSRRLVLIGAGHAHAIVLEAWARAPLAEVDLVVVSPYRIAPYSGMVPGWLAGAYRFDEIGIDFEALCARAGARWLPASLARLDPSGRHVELDDGTRLTYDLLSLNVGSTLTPPQGTGDAQVLSMRPLSELRVAWEALLERWVAPDDARPLRVTAVGGGAAGFESLLAVLRRLRALRHDRQVLGALWSRSGELLPGHPPSARRAALRALRDAGVELRLGEGWRGESLSAGDLILWATGAQAHEWQRDPARRGDLAVGPEGFVAVDRQLRSVSHPEVFAAGDCADWAEPLPKAGVHAVRMGPVLAHNLRAALLGEALRSHHPQSAFLTLLATADGRAIASRGAWSLSGRWAWRWKDRIDRAFVRRFSSPEDGPTRVGIVHGDAGSLAGIRRGGLRFDAIAIEADPVRGEPVPQQSDQHDGRQHRDPEVDAPASDAGISRS